MNSILTRRDGLEATAVDWRDPQYGPRAEAVEATREAPNRWTPEVLEYALNRWMQSITAESLEPWLGSGGAGDGKTVGVLHGTAEPTEGIRELLAAVGVGHNYLGAAAGGAAALVPAFANDLGQRISDMSVRVTSPASVYAGSDAVMAQPSWNDADAVREECSAHGLASENVFLRPARLAVGVLDGHESDDECDRFAEDLLLYEGQGHRRLAVLWAPRDLEPDPYLRAMARFRGAFPGHPDTPGALEMKKAFLEARDEPHAYASGLEFLVSRGDPEPQSPGHFRWAEYDDLGTVREWLGEEGDRVSAVVAREGLHEQLPVDGVTRTPGDLHFPSLDDEEGEDIVRFVRSLA